MVRAARTILAALAALLVAAVATRADAGPLKTWGADPPEPDPTPAAPSQTPPPPPPPPVTAEDPGPVLPPPPDAPAPPPVGPGGLRYVLEGVEIRGNTSTLSRVILRAVPFKRGAPLDV